MVAHSMELDELLFSSFFMDHGNNNEQQKLSSNLNSLIKIAEVGVTDAIPINPSSKEVNTSISFQKSYTDPIVIATLCGGQGYVGAGCKVMSIKNNGATFKTYTTSPVGSDYSFYISYLVVVKNNQFKLA